MRRSILHLLLRQRPVQRLDMEAQQRLPQVCSSTGTPLHQAASSGLFRVPRSCVLLRHQNQAHGLFLPWSGYYHCTACIFLRVQSDLAEFCENIANVHARALEVHLARECDPGQDSLFCSCGRIQPKAWENEPEVHLAREAWESIRSKYTSWRSVMHVCKITHTKCAKSAYKVKFSAKLFDAVRCQKVCTNMKLHAKTCEQCEKGFSELSQ